MSLKDQLMADMKSAMRNKQTVELDTIRLLRAAVQRKEIDARAQLDDQGILAVAQKLIKQGQDAAAQFTHGGRDDLTQKEHAGIAVLQRYLPTPLSEHEIDDLIAKTVAATGAASIKDMGRVIGALKAQLQGRADMATVSAKIKHCLQ